MSYKETIEYLYSQLPMFQRDGSAAYKVDLSNTLALDRHLGHPHKEFSSIHIAGTNGKGSVAHMLAAILREAGFTTGLYTSPHLKDFRERIRVNGECIAESQRLWRSPILPHPVLRSRWWRRVWEGGWIRPI
jgi:dihydrofolate synthase/folylpolyglutamate synthase